MANLLDWEHTWMPSQYRETQKLYDQKHDLTMEDEQWLEENHSLV